MTEKEIYDILSKKFRDDVSDFVEDVPQPFFYVNNLKTESLSMFLRDEDGLEFDSLMNLSGVDKNEELEVVYHLYSYKYKHFLTFKTKVPRDKPEVESVAMIWRTADWHEREAYDLLGINFLNHPDLRRILLPEDWEGYPLRKDYETPSFYNGMPVPYKDDEDGDLNDE